jgi:hypothetical protein
VAKKSMLLLQTINALRPLSNPNLLSDLNTGFWMAIAAAKGALENVAINLKSVHDESFLKEAQSAQKEVEENYLPKAETTEAFKLTNIDERLEAIRAEVLKAALLYWPQVFSVGVGALLIGAAYVVWQSAQKRETPLGFSLTILLAVLGPGIITMVAERIHSVSSNITVRNSIVWYNDGVPILLVDPASSSPVLLFMRRRRLHRSGQYRRRPAVCIIERQRLSLEILLWQI